MTEDLAALNALVDGYIHKDEELEVKAALYVLAAGARRDFPDAEHLVLDDSDQGSWLVVQGVMVKGEFVDVEDNDWDRSSNLYDNRTYVYNPYLVEEAHPNPSRRRGPYAVVIDRVLADRNTLLGIPPEVRLDFTQDDRGQLICPYEDCAALNNIVEIDRAERANESLDVVIENGVLVHVTWRDSKREFHHQGYQCSVCNREVTLPDNPTEDWT